jgi:SAM-dependent methyltransferase
MSGQLQKLLRTIAHIGHGANSSHAPDGFPLPPARLIETVAGTPDPEWFLEGGRRGARTISDMLALRGRELADFGAVLDFGCGCGRVMRHLAAPAGGRKGPALYGTDYNRRLLTWCRRNLPVAEYATNRLRPPTSHEDGRFGFIFAFSVFTHLTEVLQLEWIAELHRILEPGGLLLVSVHGDRYVDTLDDPERARYHAGETVVRSADSAGGNRCASFHSEQCVRTRLAAGFEVLEFVPEGALGNPHQDAYLLRRTD